MRSCNGIPFLVALLLLAGMTPWHLSVHYQWVMSTAAQTRAPSIYRSCAITLQHFDPAVRTSLRRPGQVMLQPEQQRNLWKPTGS